MKSKFSVKKVVLAALISALVCVFTMLIKVPSPLKGYVNLGDAIVLTAGWVMSPAYGFLAAGIGSMLADVFSGYLVYAPVTFLIKGLMAVLAYFIVAVMKKFKKPNFAKIIGGICAEAFMVLGYYVFEGFLYGFGPSLVNIPANCVQGVAGILLGLVTVKVIEKSNISFK